LQVTNITKLKVKYKIDLENGKHFYVSENTIIKYGLIKKIDLTREQLKEIIAHESIESAYSKAVHYLQFGLRTKQDIREYLQKKEIADNVIDTTEFEFGRYYKFDIPATVKEDKERLLPATGEQEASAFLFLAAITSILSLLIFQKNFKD